MRSQARSDQGPGSLATVPINAFSCYQEVAFHFIGTAIRLAGMKCHPDYLAAILRPETTQDVLDCVGDQTTVWPKIVQGRFMLKLCREFTTWKDQFCPDTLTGLFGGLCRHLKFIDGSTEKLGQEVKAAFEDYGRKGCTRDSVIKRTFSCNSCPTDIELEIGAGHAKFLVWCDLGTGVYPVDELWLSRTRYIPFGHKPPTFKYVHGSVREMYEHR